MNEKNILSLLVGPGLFSNKELKEVASRALNTKFLQEFDELNIKIPDAKENEPMADDGDASPISIDDEEERRMQEENERMSKKVTGLFSKPNATKNLFQKSQYESTDYENFEDEEENQSTEQISNQLPFMIPKAKDIKPNPYEKMTTSQLLTVLGTEKNGEIYRLSDMYLPTTKEHRGNVFKYLYKNMMRNPKDALRMSKNRHEGIKVFEKQILTMFGRLYEHKFVTKQEAPVAKAPEANVFLLKDAATNPTSYSNNPVFSPLNSAEWFEGLERDLLKGITTETKMEVEKEVHDVHEDLDGNKQNGETEANHIWKPQNGPIASNHAFGGENKLIPMEPSSRRVAHGTPSGHTAAGIKEKERTDKYNFQKVLSSLFESTPTRDNDNQEPSVRSEEDQSVANPFGGDSPGNDNESTGFHKVYNRSVNQNMREYLNDHYDRDRKALFSFYTGLRGHDKEETALWGEISKEVANGYEGMNGMSHNAAQERINYNYVVLPFKNEKERSIFKYETDIQDASEMEMSLLQKKRKLDKNSEIKIKVGVSIESMYYNKNVLEASWNDFFFKAKVNIRKEREYGQIVIDLNDKSVFYDRIHPIVFGVQKATRKAIQAMEEVPDQAAMFDGQQFEDNKDAPRIDTSDLQPGGVPLRPSVSKDYLGVGGTQHVPSESGSMSIGNRKSNITKQQKLKLKAMRVEAVKSGLNIEHLTKEDARNLLLGRTGKSESKVDNVALPNILRVINDLKKKISTQSIIQHSKVAEEFQFNEFHIKKEEFEHFHRPDMRRLMNDQAYQPWRIEIVKQEEEKKDQSFVPEDPFGVNELVHSFEHFKNHRRLSLKEGKFALFEYIEENPLILSNVGMASRINRYVYSQRAYAKVQQQQAAKGAQVTENQELMEFVKMIKETLGPNGSISFLDESKNIPLIGQLTKDNFVGVTVLDNNLFYAPIFIHKAPETDFVLVRYTSSDGTQKCYLRKIEYIYTVGQIEPKVEVFNPSCRGLTSFIRKSTKHIIKKKFKDKEIVYLEEMKQLFPTVNDHNMKKAIQRYGGDPDPDDNKRFFYNKDLDNELNDEDADRSEGNITPEEVCQYERMHASNVRLKNVGLEDLRSCDKINTVRKRYMTRNNLKIWNETILHPDKRNYTKMNIVANYVSEELQLTAWNLSQSFLSSKQKQGRLCLTGFGDPTSGHGGYSYVKLPLKTSRYEKEDKKSNANKLNQVTGTEADLRKLPIKLVDKMILTYGNYKEDHISKLTRWDKIDLLRQIANEHPDEKELKKYTRQFRLTTKMQKEKYQKDINTLFMKLVDNLSRPGRDDIPSDNEGDFDCGIEQLIDKELEDIMKKAPKDLKQAEAQALDDDDDKGDDGDGDVDGSYAGDGGDDGSDIFQD